MSSGSKVSAISVENEREINPMELSIEQLNAVRVQHEEEISELNKYFLIFFLLFSVFPSLSFFSAYLCIY